MISLKEIVSESDWTLEKVNVFPLPQTFAYGEIQKKAGRDIRRFAILNDEKIIGLMQFVFYPLFGSLKYWYAPYGPILESVSDEIILDIKKELTKIAKKENVVFLRLDPTPTLNSEDKKIFQKYFKESLNSSYVGAYFQPRGEWYTDITKSKDEILMAMHQKTRYSVRLAEKKGIKIEIVKQNLTSKLPDFLLLMKLTAKRNGFSLHHDGYYEAYFEEAEKTGNGFVIEARFNDKILATHFVFVVGDVAHYVFGASSNEDRELCAPYLAHFEGMLEAKNMNAEYYNFGAIATESADAGWSTITIFKQKFGGKAILHSPLFDLVLKPLWYYIYILRKLVKSYL